MDKVAILLFALAFLCIAAFMLLSVNRYKKYIAAKCVVTDVERVTNTNEAGAVVTEYDVVTLKITYNENRRVVKVSVGAEQCAMVGDTAPVLFDPDSEKIIYAHRAQKSKWRFLLLPAAVLCIVLGMVDIIIPWFGSNTDGVLSSICGAVAGVCFAIFGTNLIMRENAFMKDIASGRLVKVSAVYVGTVVKRAAGGEPGGDIKYPVFEYEADGVKHRFHTNRATHEQKNGAPLITYYDKEQCRVRERQTVSNLGFGLAFTVLGLLVAVLALFSV